MSLLDWLVEHEPLFRKTRIPSLYSDLTVQKSSNPEGYAANVTAWTSALTRLTMNAQLPPEQHHLILQTSNDLLSALASPQFGQPSGLGCILDDCLKQGKMVDLKEFISTEKSIYSRSWLSFPSPLDVMRWGLKQFGVVGNGSYDLSGGRLRGGSLVIVAALEELWKHVQAGWQRSGHSGLTLTDRILSREAFIKQINDGQEEGRAPFSAQDITVFLRYLERDKQALTYDETTIKLKSPAATISRPEPITKEDRHIASLKLLISTLLAQTDVLQSRVSTLQANAQTCVRENNKAGALSALRSKKMAEHTLAARSATLFQLQQVYTKIEDAVDQIQAIEAMEASAGVLKGLNTQIGGIERVEDVLENLREEMGKVDEVSGVIAEPLDGKAVLDEGEVDEELEVLQKEELEKLRAKEADETRGRLMKLEAVELEREREKVREEQESLELDLSSGIEKLQTLDVSVRTPRVVQDRERTTQAETSLPSPKHTNNEAHMERIPQPIT